jgi:hypothetical protein
MHANAWTITLNELIKSLPITTKTNNKELTKLAVGNIVCSTSQGKNYRIIDSSDSCGRMVEIDTKGMIVDNKTIKIFSKMVEQRYILNCEPVIYQHQDWYTTSNYISNKYVWVKIKDGRYSNITGIDDIFIMTVVPW